MSHIPLKKKKSLNPTQTCQTSKQNHNHFIEIHNKTSYMNIVHQIVTLSYELVFFLENYANNTMI
jgi:hypothetical protein